MIEDLLLRVVSNPPLVAKGSQLTWQELDGNFVEIYNAIMANYLSSYVDAYDNVVTYDNVIVNYAVYDSVIWKFINGTPNVGTTPGTDPTRWERVFASDLAHKKNSDTILAEGTADEVTAEQLAILVNAGAVVFSVSKLVASADVKTAFSVPVKVITHPGGAYAGKKIKILSAEIENLIELSPASVAYVSNLTMNLYTNTATRVQFNFSNILNATIARCGSGALQGISSGTDTQLIADESVFLNTSTGDTTTGDYDVLVTATYIFI